MGSSRDRRGLASHVAPATVDATLNTSSERPAARCAGDPRLEALVFSSGAESRFGTPWASRTGPGELGAEAAADGDEAGEQSPLLAGG